MGTFNLELKSGKQIFPLNYENLNGSNFTNNIKNIKYIKIIIKESYGEDRTYINQIMLFEKSSKEVSEFLLKESLENNKIINNNFNIEDFKELLIKTSQNNTSEKEDLEISETEVNKLNSTDNLPISQNSYELLEKTKKSEEIKKNEINNYQKYERKNNDIYIEINKNINEEINNDISKDINNDINIQKKENENYDDNYKINKSKKVMKIENILKQNILENDSKRGKIEEDNNKMHSQNSNKFGNIYNKKNIIFGLSSNQINKKEFPHTPNRFIINKNNEIINNINFKKRQYSPNITHFDNNDKNMNNNIDKNNNSNNFSYKEEINNITFTKNKSININNIKNSEEEKDYDNILQNQLNDMQKQISLLEKGINISDNKINSKNRNYLNKNNNYDQNCFGQSSNTYFYHTNFWEKNNLKKYNKFSPINSIPKFSVSSNNNHKNILLEKKNNINYKYKSPTKYNNDKISDNSFQEEEEQINNDRYNTISKYVLKDLTSNNSNDINSRIYKLEKSVNDIKKDIKLMSSILLNLTSNNFFENNFKEQIKQICNDYLNEKINSDENIKSNNYMPNYNNNNNENHSFYSEFLNDENKQKNIYENNKKFENEINKRIDQKLEYFGEEIKNDIYNKLIKPSINQIENNMKKNFDEIKEKINEMNKINYINNYNDKKNKMMESITNSDLLSKGTSKLRNERFEEINRLEEKLYQKLLEKEKKLRLLKQETSKFLEENY